MKKHLKRLAALSLALGLSAAGSMAAYAGAWQQDAAGWWYDNGDSTYAKSGWHWIDGRCYYFTDNGYCLINTSTPDGYTVDGSGAWIVDGVVQTQNPTETPAQTDSAKPQYTVGTLTVTAPEGFTLVSEGSDMDIFDYGTGTSEIALLTAASYLGDEFSGNVSVLGDQAYTLIDTAMDLAMQSQAGDYTAKTVGQFASGTWTRYDYASAAQLGLPGSLTAYVRVQGNYLHMVMFAGYISGADTDAWMNQLVK